MTFADQYKAHAYADLIREAETQGIETGVRQEQERIIALLEKLSCDCDEDCDIVEIPFHNLKDLIAYKEDKPKHPFEYEGWND